MFNGSRFLTGEKRYPLSPHAFYIFASDVGKVRKNRAQIERSPNVFELLPFIGGRFIGRGDPVEWQKIGNWWLEHGFDKKY